MSGNAEEKPSILSKANSWHDFLHILILIVQVVLLIIQISLFSSLNAAANNISAQNAQIQHELYAYEPRISGYSKIVWLKGQDYYSSFETYAEVEIFIMSPHPVEFNLTIKTFSPYTDNVDMNNSENTFYMREDVRDIAYSQGYKYEGSVPLVARVKPLSSVGIYFYVGRLDFQIEYFDAKGNSNSTTFSAAVYFELQS
jgi:hypothetical protein